MSETTAITIPAPSSSVIETLRWSLTAATSEFGTGDYDDAADEWLDLVDQACKLVDQARALKEQP